LKFELDPTVPRVVTIGILLFFEALIGGILVVLNDGAMPTNVQWLTILLVAALTIVTYYLSFLRTGETE